MMNDDYTERFRAEYQHVKKRYEEIESVVLKTEAGLLSYELPCSISLIAQQGALLWHYLRVLEKRAEVEGIEL